MLIEKLPKKKVKQINSLNALVIMGKENQSLPVKYIFKYAVDVKIYGAS